MTHAFLCLSRSIEDSSVLCKFCGCETHGSGCGDDRVDDCGKGCDDTNGSEPVDAGVNGSEQALTVGLLVPGR